MWATKAVRAVTLIGSMKKDQMPIELTIHISHGWGVLPRRRLKKVKMAISEGAATANRTASERFSLRISTDRTASIRPTPAAGRG